MHRECATNRGNHRALQHNTIETLIVAVPRSIVLWRTRPAGESGPRNHHQTLTTHHHLTFATERSHGAMGLSWSSCARSPAQEWVAGIVALRRRFVACAPMAAVMLKKQG